MDEFENGTPAPQEEEHPKEKEIPTAHGEALPYAPEMVGGQDDTAPGESQETGEEEPKKKSLGREILEWVLVVVVAVAAALLIRTFIFEPVRVDGSSMLNTLQDNEYMVVTKYQYLFGDPERFDVVICHYPGRGNTNFVKRVVGIPGDTVEMRDGTLFVNGEAVEEPYIDFKANYSMSPITVEEDHYFVLGDNRPHSNDSHAAGVGQLTRDQIVGKVRLVAWPISAWRVIK